ncbi:MAG TPA: valine--tRNA ligase [Gemmatimonadales bacterium]|nr:valine--tRNA ligase [Gemmatimonadales bacterium]
MTEPLAPQYTPAAIEGPLYSWWQERGFFRAAPDAPGEPYVVQMPPPNVTARLHMGHGLNDTTQDVLVRFERMRGKNTLWVPGTDHAGIATQNVIEKQLAKEGLTRFDLGRDAFVDRVKAFVAETGGEIIEQLKALGCSADWERTYYTFSPDLSATVREVFARLYEKGLIYRGKYIVNWCPRCLTTLSNEEVEKEEKSSSLWHFRYPLADGGDSIVVATTRPETMLGDTGIAVHPDDPRYQGMIGKMVALPLTDREIPIVGDSAVDPAFGSGAVKVTPAHDPVDFEIGRRHNLMTIDVMTPEARMSQTVPERFQGLDRMEARKQVVAAIQALGLLVKVDPHTHAVGHCYRCNTVVEPRLSDQWFVKMAPLAKPALQAYHDGKLRFIPEFQGGVYAYWLENIRDWCISRQLWWGHRIPVWYCQSEGCRKTIVAREEPTHCPECRGHVIQDEDVLDTWFSSWLVPFTSLGWPEKTPSLRAFYPGSTLITAPEIIYLWVARMIMSGLEFMGEVPFDTIYLHGTVRDAQHRKMSKSLGNGVDPIEVIDRYGADALRYTIVSGMSVGTDLILDTADLDTAFAPGRFFANKLWNIGRFVLGHLEQGARPLAEVDLAAAPLADRWILARARAAIVEATAHYERFRFNEAAMTVYRFLWSDVADWYVEQIKPRLYGNVPGGETARAVAAHVFDIGLKLLHPVMPFITEELWRRLPNSPADASISVSAWPTEESAPADDLALLEFGALQDLIGAIRVLRADQRVPPGQTVEVAFANMTALARALVSRDGDTIQRLAKVSAIHDDGTPDLAGTTLALPDGPIVVALRHAAADPAKECARLATELARSEQLLAAQLGKLANEQFVARAPAALIEKERERLAVLESQVETLREQRRALGCPA